MDKLHIAVELGSEMDEMHILEMHTIYECAYRDNIF